MNRREPAYPVIDDNPLLSAMISLNVAYAEEAQGACEQALRNFETVLSAPAATVAAQRGLPGYGPLPRAIRRPGGGSRSLRPCPDRSGG